MAQNTIYGKIIIIILFCFSFFLSVFQFSDCFYLVKFFTKKKQEAQARKMSFCVGKV